MKLNLGCGMDKKKGYINIDVRREVNPDLVWNLEQLPYPFDDESIEEIIAKDVLEHFSYRRIEPIIKEWHRILKADGKLFIQAPDLLAIAYKVILNPQMDYWRMSYWLYGGQEYPENTHKAGFTIQTLKTLLERMGFKVERIENDGGTNLICWARKI